VKKEIGTRIRKLRESKDYTQDNMAVELEITAGAYAKIERGETDPSISRLFQIAEILKVDITALIKDSPTTSFLLEDSQLAYGNLATKQDLVKITHLINQMNREIEKLKSQNTPKKKITPKKKTK
jgi:transcriptional regulator with XRE-family HTH domain